MTEAAASREVRKDCRWARRASWLALALVAVGVLSLRVTASQSPTVHVSYPDEMITPDFDGDARFGWWSHTAKYPPLAFLGLQALGPRRATLGIGLHVGLAWLATMVLAFAVDRVTRSLPAAILSGIAFVTTPCVLFYAATLQVETMHVFWLVMAVAAAAVSVGRAGGAWPCLLVVSFAAAAVLTKDQAYPLAIPLGAWCIDRVRRHGRTQAIGIVLGVIVSVVLALLSFWLIAAGLPGRTTRDAVIAHVTWITSGGSQPYRDHSSGPAGWPGLLGDCAITLGHHANPLLVALALGLVAFGAAAWLRTVRSGAKSLLGSSASALAVAGMVSFVALFLIPIGYVEARYWTTSWPLVLLAAAAVLVAVLRDRERWLRWLVAAAVLLASLDSAVRTLWHVSGDPRRELLPALGVADESRSVGEAIIPVTSREFGSRYVPPPEGWKEVPAIRNWVRNGYGTPRDPSVTFAGLLPHPFDIALYAPPMFVSRDDEVPPDTAAAWGYRELVELKNENEHPALPPQPTFHVHVVAADADGDAWAALAADPLTREEAWLVGSHLVPGLLPAADGPEARAFARRFARAWTTGATGDPEATAPDHVDARAVRAVRYLLDVAATADR